MSLKLYSSFGHPLTNKVLVVASLAKIQIELIPTYPPNKELEHKNPFNKIPVLETADGPLFESNAILRYLTHNS